MHDQSHICIEKAINLIHNYDTCAMFFWAEMLLKLPKRNNKDRKKGKGKEKAWGTWD